MTAGRGQRRRSSIRSAIPWSLALGLLGLVRASALDPNLAQADYCYANNQLDPRYLAISRDLCRGVLERNPTDGEALWRMARSWLALAESKSGRRERLAAYDTALGYAERGRRREPGSADAQYWYGVVLGRTAQVRGVVNFLGQIRSMKAAFEKAIALDPNHAGALNALGIWYAEASRYYSPWTADAVGYLKRALAADPNFSAAYVSLARVDIRRKNYADARRLLETVLALKNPTIPADFFNFAKPEAERLLGSLPGS